MSEERYVPLAEVKEMLEEESKLRELTPEQKLALDQASKMSRTDADKAGKLMKELTAIDFISEGVAVKIVDLMPMHADDIRVLFAKERLVLDKKQIEQIIKLVEKYF
ncbi:MAG: RNA polymerase Rpb4 [Methanomassiliicoccales archaeon PtaU1.Bin124]|nr:MAG: RNA polymerase Rpb4 [Methanomassiliicoccales archaeon PtaU1.Bin124]